MAAPDPLLTSLCTTCHNRPPRYSCPRCGARSCSLECVRRHKSRAGCNGIRDVTAFVPRAQLRTAKYVDHDYNFLTAIERSRERNAKHMVDDRGIFTDEEIEARARRMRGLWTDGELRFVEPRAFADAPGGGPAAAAERTPFGGDDASQNKKRVRRLCRDMDLDVTAAPKGLSRQRENTTAWNRRTGRINWQVEWLVYEEGTARPPTRMLRKTLDDVPVYRAFAETMQWLIHQLEAAQPFNDDDDDDGPPRKKRRTKAHHREGGAGRAQDAFTTAWPVRTPYPGQNPVTGVWDIEDGAAEMSTWTRDVEFEDKRRYRFLLHKPRTKPKALLPMAADDTLATALQGRSIVEFPTVVVIPPGEDLPPDYILDKTPRPTRTANPVPRPDSEPSNPKALKRGRPQAEEVTAGETATNPFRQAVDAILANGRAPAAKRRRVAFAPIQEVEDGEVAGDGMEEDDPTSSEGSTSSDGEDQDGSASEEGEVEEAGIRPVSGRPQLVMYESCSDEED